jgi:hypothetical protein
MYVDIEIENNGQRRFEIEHKGKNVYVPQAFGEWNEAS